MSKIATTQCLSSPVYAHTLWLFCLLTSAVLLLSGCAGLQSSRVSETLVRDYPVEPEPSAGHSSGMSYAEQVFRKQNDVADRSMFMLDENQQISDEMYEALRQREEGMYEACQHLNEMARIRSQQQDGSWWLKLKILLTLGECELAANELDYYLLNLQTEAPATALGAL